MWCLIVSISDLCHFYYLNLVERFNYLYAVLDDKLINISVYINMPLDLSFLFRANIVISDQATLLRT